MAQTWPVLACLLQTVIPRVQFLSNKDYCTLEDANEFCVFKISAQNLYIWKEQTTKLADVDTFLRLLKI